MTPENGRKGPRAELAPQDEEAALFGLRPVAPDSTRTYGPHASQRIDLYTARRPRGVRVTLLHGGFWREAYDRSYLTPFAAALARRYGIAVALVEYRRVGGGGGWPTTFDDVRSALDHLGPPGDHDLLLGHSAGGHLALWAAATRAWAGWTVAVSPVADLERAHQLGLSADAVAELLGGADQVDARLEATDPMRLPFPRPPAVVLHGAADLEVPLELSERYAAASGATLRVGAETGHYAPFIPGTAAFADLLAVLLDQGR